MSLGPQVRSDAQSMTGKELDDAMFEKMSIDNQMGTLEDSAENFRQMIDMMPISEIAEANGMSLEEAKNTRILLLIIITIVFRISDLPRVLPKIL